MTNCRLIYRSVAFDETLSNKSLAHLQKQCTSNNEALGITGMLLLSGDQFLQVIEGDSAKINQVYAKIVADPRHHTVQLISFENTNECYFDDWALRLIDLYDLPLQARQLLSKKYPSVDENIRIPDQLNLVYSLLTDAKVLCLAEPWK